MRDRLVRFQVVYVPVRQSERLAPGVAADDDILVVGQVFRHVVPDPKSSDAPPAFGKFRIDRQRRFDRVGGGDHSAAAARPRFVFGLLSADDQIAVVGKGKVFGPAFGRQAFGGAERLKTSPFFKKRFEQGNRNKQYCRIEHHRKDDRNI